ncbi:MAG: hypothetical protein Q8Q09_26060 [Deltaproteobacteria bacterium]|nr:hypothetical protein [Deltaproteobacteria bacterium]
MKQLILATTTMLALTAVGGDVLAQGVLDQNTRGSAVALHLGGGYGSYLGAGQGDIELQLHFGRSYAGPGIAVGLSLPIANGLGIGVEGRFVYDIQLIPGKAFFITPYVGAIVGFWNWHDGRGSSAGYLWLGPQFGLDLNFVLFDRLLLGVRPIGVTIPVFFGGPGVHWSYHSALTIGITF